MRIGVCGTQCTGKSTFIQDFLKNWPNYKADGKKYTDFVKEKGLTLNEESNEYSQKTILDFTVERILTYKKEDNVILDRTVLDNLVYTLWLNEHDKVQNSFLKETALVVKESLVFYDLLLFFPITKASPVVFTPSEHRSCSEQYRMEIDNIFKGLLQLYYKNSTAFFPFDNKIGCPAIVEIFGNREERIALTKMYLDENGNVFGEKDSLIAQ